MSPLVKFLLGLAAVMLFGWAWHGPAGHGEALVTGLEARAKAVVAASDVPGIDVRLARNPLSRTATLSGPADDLQRRGMGTFPGLTQRVEAVDGIARVRWTDEPDADKAAIPLLAETLADLVLAYLMGIGLAWLFWGRPPRQGFA